MTLKNKPKINELVANLRRRGFNYAANLIESQPHPVDSDEIANLFRWSSTHPGHEFWNYISAKLNERWQGGAPVIYCPPNKDYGKNA